MMKAPINWVSIIFQAVALETCLIITKILPAMGIIIPIL